jgi:hypothetical protein
MEGRDTTYVVLFSNYNGLAVWQVHSAVVSKEDYYNVNRGDLVEFDVEAGKNPRNRKQ